MRHTVLIADDDDDVRLLLRVVFEHETDFEVVGEAATPHDAIEVAHRHQPNVVIIDHEFRGYISGSEASPILRDKCPRSLIVMFSAYDAIRTQSETTSAIDAFVLKTDISMLPSTVRALLAGRAGSPE